MDDEIRRGMARMAAASAWGLGEWSTMSEYVQMIPEDSVEGAFYRSVTAVQGERFVQARQVRGEDLLNASWCAVHSIIRSSSVYPPLPPARPSCPSPLPPLLPLPTPPLLPLPLLPQLISMARDVLDTELTALVGESYNRAYGAMVQVQLLSELEEVIEYKMHPDRRNMIKKAWWDRLQVRRIS